MIKNTKEFDYDPVRVKQQLQNIDGLISERDQRKKEIDDLEKKLGKIREDNATLNMEIEDLQKLKETLTTQTIHFTQMGKDAAEEMKGLPSTKPVLLIHRSASLRFLVQSDREEIERRRR
jgi:regulator of replication initiation timing